MRRHAPEILDAMRASVREGTPERPRFFVFGEQAMRRAPSISIDYALMEKTDRAVVVPCDLGWSDIGSWSTLYEASADKSAGGNAVSMDGKVLAKDVSGSILAGTDSGKLLAVSNLHDFMVIDTDKVLLVCPRDDRKFQEILSELALPEYSEYK